MKLKDAVEMICELDQIVDEKYRLDLYGRARFLVRMGVLNPDFQVSKGQTAQYRLDTVCALRMCFGLYDCGLEYAVVSEIAPSFHRPMMPGRDESPHPCLSSAIEAIRAERRAVFFLENSRLVGQKKVKRVGYIEIDGQRTVPIVRSSLIDDFVVSDVRFSMDLNTLLTDVINAFDETAG